MGEVSNGPVKSGEGYQMRNVISDARWRITWSLGGTVMLEKLVLLRLGEDTPEVTGTW